MRAEILNLSGEAGPVATGTPAGITAVVLAGGKAERFAGLDKGLIPVGGRALIKRVVEQLVTQVGQIVIVTNRNQALYASYGYRVVSDALPDHQGPLSGIAAGLAAIETSHALFVPVGAARLPGNLARTLWQPCSQNNASCVVHGPDRPIASCCLVAKSERGFAEAALA